MGKANRFTQWKNRQFIEINGHSEEDYGWEKVRIKNKVHWINKWPRQN